MSHGSDCTPVEAKAPAGYSFFKWTKDGTLHSGENPLTMTNAIEDMTLIAVFGEFSGVEDWILYE